MAKLSEAFITDEMPKGTSFDPLPAGWYTVTITKADITPTKNGTGEYIKVRYDVVGPTHAGRVVFGNLNTKNESAKAQEIGRQQVGELLRACGIAVLKDTDQLIGCDLDIKLSIRKGDGQYDDQNEVKGFRAVEGGAIPKAAGKPAPSGAAPAEGGKKSPPWAKKG